jgi:hypothetical protein
MCLSSIVLSRPYVVRVYVINVIEVGLSLFLAVCFAGFRAHRICWGLYPLYLKTMVRNSSSWVRESRSQRALSMWNREARTNCSFAGWWCEFWRRERLVWVYLPSIFWSSTRHPSFRLAQANLSQTFIRINSNNLTQIMLPRYATNEDATDCSETSTH